MLALTIEGTTEYLADTAEQEAMRRHWEAKQRGDIATLKRVADLPVVTTSTRPGEVSPVAVARIASQEAWLDEGGFELPPPIFAPGKNGSE